MKKILNGDATFLAERASSLVSYLDKVVRHPRLSASLDLLVFLDASEAGLEAARTYIEARAADERDSLLERGVGAVMSFAFDAPLDLKPDAIYEAAVTRHVSRLSLLSASASSGEAVAAAMRATTSALQDAGKALLALGEHESRYTNVLTTSHSSVSMVSSHVDRVAASVCGSGVFPVATGDTAAAAAFHAHERALAASGDMTIAGMFTNADRNDPHSAFAAANAAPTSTSTSLTVTNGAVETLHDILALAGRTLIEEGGAWREQLKTVDSTLLVPFRAERDKEAGLGEAVLRRDTAIERVREANNTLSRKKKAMLSLKPADKDYAPKMTSAQAAVEKADASLAARKAELEKLTTVLKVR